MLWLVRVGFKWIIVVILLSIVFGGAGGQILVRLVERADFLLIFITIYLVKNDTRALMLD